MPFTPIQESIVFSKIFDVYNKDLTVTIDYKAYSTDNVIDGGFVLGLVPFYRVAPDGYTLSAGMCYSSVSGVSGIKDAQVGIGFDFSGQFSLSSTGTGGTSAVNPNTICLRGPASAYSFITKTANLSTVTPPFTLYSPNCATADIKNARIRVTDFGRQIIVDLKNKSEAKYTNYLNVQMDSAIVAYERFYVGYTTSLSNQVFQIQNVNINGYDVTIDYTVSGAYYMGLSSSLSLSYPISAIPLIEGDLLGIQNYFGINPSTTSTLYSTYSGLGPLILSADGPGLPYVSDDSYIIIDYIVDL